MKRSISSLFLASGLSCLLATGVVLTAATPASAQTVEELTVTGRYGPGDQPKSLSYAVSYRDLDLRTQFGQDELRHRIEVTVRYLCDKLGETSTSSAVVPSCRDAATKDALAQARVAIDTAPVRVAGWVPGPVWIPPPGP
jgi:UrcA family protein